MKSELCYSKRQSGWHVLSNSRHYILVFRTEHCHIHQGNKGNNLLDKLVYICPCIYQVRAFFKSMALLSVLMLVYNRLSLKYAILNDSLVDMYCLTLDTKFYNCEQNSTTFPREIKEIFYWPKQFIFVLVFIKSGPF